MEPLYIPPYPTKHVFSEVKDIDTVKRIISAYANVYGNKDWDGDISAPGSFNKTVKEQFRKLRVLKNHNPQIDIGIPKELKADDDYGLFTRTQFNMERPEAKDMFLIITDRMENGQDADLSIGYEVVKRDEKDKSIIKEYKLWEYSFLTSWGANPLAVATGAKSFDNVISYLGRLYNLPLSDAKLKQIETILKTLSEPGQPTPSEPLSIGSFAF
jgi:HK97 family phage prohead protease